MSLEIKKKQLELQRVMTARMEMELKIDERMEEIERLKANIEIQNKREQEIKEEIAKL